jgi:hypothetical protein
VSDEVGCNAGSDWDGTIGGLDAGDFAVAIWGGDSL